MKLLLACLLLPAVLAAPADKKRIIVGAFQIDDLFDLDILKCDIQIMLDVLGSDPTEQACEGECHNLLTAGATLNYGCPLICQGFKALAHTLHEAPKPGDQNMKCGGLDMTTTAAMPTTAGSV